MFLVFGTSHISRMACCSLILCHSVECHSHKPFPYPVVHVLPFVQCLSTLPCLCCLPTPMALASGGSPMFPLVVHQPASPSIWPAVQSLQGRQCGAYVGAVEEMMCVVCVDVREGA